VTIAYHSAGEEHQVGAHPQCPNTAATMKIIADKVESTNETKEVKKFQ